MERKMFKAAKKTARPSGSAHTKLSVIEITVSSAVHFFGELSIRKSLGMSGCALSALCLLTCFSRMNVFAPNHVFVQGFIGCEMGVQFIKLEFLRAR